MATATPNARHHDGLSELASRYVNLKDLPWEPTRFEGVEIKTLMIDRDSGLLTTLVRMAPGAELPFHEHVDIEQTYVVEGSLADGEGEVTAGNFVWRPAGSRHTAHSPNGGVFLSFFTKPNRFLDGEGVTDISGQAYARAD